jgi:plastocyanin domain-containing protein
MSHLDRLAVCALAATVALGCQKSPPRPAAEAKDAAPIAAAGARVIQMQVTQDGYVPSKLEVTKGEPLELHVTRTTNDTCATELIIDGTSINAPLPFREEVVIRWTPEKTGSIKYGCHMGMMISGVILVE